MKLIELKDVLQQKALSVPGINSFQFDDLSAMTGQDNDYNLLFLQLPSGVISDFSKPYQVHTINIWVFKLDEQFNPDESIVAWEETEDQAMAFIKKVIEVPNIMTLETKEITIERGHILHPDSLIGVRCTFLLRVGNCV